MRSGFTIIRNGESLGYPWQESLRSLAPLVDELVVAHGDSTDSTREHLSTLQREFQGKLIILETPWDPQSTRGGYELARQTNLALDACRGEIAFYLQCDEVLHNEDLDRLHQDLERFEHDDDVDALALTWVHFYANYESYAHSRQWYRREVRVIKRSRGLRSYGDAQGFRIPQGPTQWTKPRAALSQARCLHYGWVREPDLMVKKSEALDRLWHGHERDGTHQKKSPYPAIWGIRPFLGDHPDVMLPRIAEFKRNFPWLCFEQNPPAPRTIKNVRYALTDWIERATGWRPGEFRNFRLTKQYR